MVLPKLKLLSAVTAFDRLQPSRFRAMMVRVSFSRKQFKILDPVVMLVAIAMVDHFVWAWHCALMPPPNNVMLVGVSPTIFSSRVLAWSLLQYVWSVSHQPSLG